MTIPVVVHVHIFHAFYALDSRNVHFEIPLTICDYISFMSFILLFSWYSFILLCFNIIMIKPFIAYCTSLNRF